MREPRSPLTDARGLMPHDSSDSLCYKSIIEPELPVANSNCGPAAQPPHSLMKELIVTEIESLTGKTIKRIGFTEYNQSLVIETDDGRVDIGAFELSAHDAALSIEDAAAVPIRWVKP